MIDTLEKTITLPAHRIERLLAIFDKCRCRKHISVKKWHRVLGELRSMVLALPGGRGLFNALQLGLKHTDKHRVRLNESIQHALTNFEALAYSVASRLTRLGEIIPDRPYCTGAHDAA